MDRKVVGVVFFGMSWNGCNGCSGHLTHNCWIYLSIYPSIHPSIYLSIYLFIFKRENEAILRDFLSFELDNVKNEAIMRGLLSFRCWEPQKRSNSARLPSTMESWVQSWRLVPMHFAIFPLHLSKVLRLPRKSDARSYEVLHLSRKIILANLKIWCSKMQPVSGNQRPDLLTSMMNMSLVLRLPHERHLCRSSSNVPRLPTLLKLLQNPHIFLILGKVRNPWCLPRKTTSEPSSDEHVVALAFWLRNVLRAKTACTFSTCQLPKVVREWCGLMCFCRFWLRNVLRATTACTFSSLIWPDGSAPAALASLLFDPPEPQTIGTTLCFATFLPFRAPKSSFLWLFLFSDFISSFFFLLSSSLLFSSLTLPTSAFPFVHIVGSLS